MTDRRRRAAPALPGASSVRLTVSLSFAITLLHAPQNDIRAVYKKIEEGADVNFVFGRAYRCPEGYTPLMVACHRGR